MALAQIDEAELLSHRQVVDAVNGIMSKPEARKLLLQARKLADPNAIIPELDAAAPLNEGLSRIEKTLADLRAEREAEKAAAAQAAQIAKFEQGWNQQRQALRAAGWQDEGIAQIEAHAQERGIFDLEVAAAHWEKFHPPADPVQPSGAGSWQFLEGTGGDDGFMKAMLDSRGDDEAALNNEIRATLKEIRQPQPGARR
jgi:hypothetical protein